MKIEENKEYNIEYKSVYLSTGEEYLDTTIAKASKLNGEFVFYHLNKDGMPAVSTNPKVLSKVES